MAKWGEGDPRWLVEDRQDGKNVNAWHWQETNKLEWSKQRLAELLPGTEAVGAADAGTAAGWAARVTGLKSVTGEAMLTTRKGNKRFAFYDLKLTLAWEAAPAAPAAPAAGNGRADQPAAAAGAEAAATGGGADADADADPAAAAIAAGAAVTAAGAAAGASKEAAAATGDFSVSEFGSGSDHEDIELTVTVSGGSGGSGDKEAARKLAQAALWPLVLQKLEQYVRELEQA